MAKRIVVALQDMGCLENALPVAVRLHDQGHNVYILLGTEDGQARRQIVGGNVDIQELTITETLVASDILLTCLPTWCFEQIPSDVQVVLIPENALACDLRLHKWLQLPLFRLSVVGLPISGVEVTETGLPAVSGAAKVINAIPDDEFEMWISGDEFYLSVALPGDLDGCLRMLDTLELAAKQREKVGIFARTHPKLPEKDLQTVSDTLRSLGAIPLLEANKKSPTEQMAVGRHGMFVCDWNSTMALQAAVAGVPVGLIPPADKDVIGWVAETALLKNGHAVPFLGVGQFWETSHLVPLGASSGDPVKNIADVVISKL